MGAHDATNWEFSDDEERKGIFNSLDDATRQRWIAFNLAYELNGETSLQEIYNRLHVFTANQISLMESEFTSAV